LRQATAARVCTRLEAVVEVEEALLEAAVGLEVGVGVEGALLEAAVEVVHQQLGSCERETE
jgi:hypothetical protein